MKIYQKITIFCLSVFFSLTPIISLLLTGPFSWHIKQPSFTHGILEVLIIFLSLYIMVSIKKFKFIHLIFFIPIIIFTRRHGIDISIIINLYYIFGILSLGLFFVKKMYPIDKLSFGEIFFISLFSGTILWVLVIWILSFFGFGSINNIRFVAIAVLSISIISSGALKLITIHKFKLNQNDKIINFFLAFLITTFLTLFAKVASSSINFDSLWYGLRIDKILLGNSNIFEPHYFSALVHYYPQLYESLLIPLSGLSSVSIPVGFTIFFTYILIYACYLFLKQLGIKNYLSFTAISLIANIPALGFIASTTKGDIFAAFFGVLSIFFISKYLEGKKFYFFLILSTIILAPLARLSFLPYSFVLFLFLIFLALKDKEKAKIFNIRYFTIFLLSSVIFSLIMFRTWLLSGVFFISPGDLVNIQKYFGLSNFDFIHIISRPNHPNLFSSLPWALWSYFFYPANIGIQLISWIGNGWIFFLILYFIFQSKNKIIKTHLSFQYLFLIFFILFALLLFGTRHSINRGLDGNYFIFPIICLYFMSFFLLNNLSLKYKYIISSTSILFSVSTFLIIFFTVYWHPGTRKFDLNFTKKPNELNLILTKYNYNKDNKGLYNFFHQLQSTPRVSGKTLKEEYFQLLPIKYESLDMITWSTYNRTNIMEYFNLAKIKYFILQRDFMDFCNKSKSNLTSGHCPQVLTIMNKKNSTLDYQNNKYLVFKLNK
jgi:hypothetical protein